MKIQLVAMATLISGSLFAQSRQDLENKALRVTRKVERVTRENLDLMNKAQLKKVIRLTKEAIRTARGTDTRSQIINIKIEDQPFVLEAGTIGSLYTKCRAKLPTLVNRNADDIFVSLQGGPQVVGKHKNGYWISRASKCQTVAILATKSSFRAGKPLATEKYTVHGFANNIPILAEGSNFSQLETSCKENLRMLGGVPQVDNMQIQLNNSKVKSHRNRSNYWIGSNQICSAAIALIFKNQDSNL